MPLTNRLGSKTFGWTPFIDSYDKFEISSDDSLDNLSEFSTEASVSEVSSPADRLLSVAEFDQLPSQGVINPYRLRTAQGGINATFRDQSSLDTMRNQLIQNPRYTHHIHPIEIGIYQNKVYSFDTRRLIVHQQAKEIRPDVFIRYRKIEGDELKERVERIFSPRPWNGAVTAIRYGGKRSESQAYINPSLRPQLEKIVQTEFKSFPQDRQGADDNGFPIKKAQAKKIYKYYTEKHAKDCKHATKILKTYNTIKNAEGNEQAYDYLINLKIQSKAKKIFHSLTEKSKRGSSSATDILKKYHLKYDVNKESAYKFLVNLNENTYR